MKKINLRDRENKWTIYHKFEKETRKRFLRKLSTIESFNLFQILYQFTYQLGPMCNYNKLNMSRIKTLVRTHSILDKIRK